MSSENWFQTPDACHFDGIRNVTPAQIFDLRLQTQCVALPLQTGCCHHPVPMLARSQQEAWNTLDIIGGGVTGTGLSNTYLGMTMPTVRAQYYAALERAEREIAQRRAILGRQLENPAVYRGFVAWASAKRTSIARVFRIPMGPGAMLGGELRDNMRYGLGGRSLSNLEARNMARGLTQQESLTRILGSVDRPNAQVTAQALKAARILRSGGVVLFVGGLGLTGYEISQAQPKDRPYLVKKAAATTGASFGASTIAVGFAVMLGATGVGLIAIGIVAGVAAAYGTEEVFFSDAKANHTQALLTHGFVHARDLKPMRTH